MRSPPAPPPPRGCGGGGHPTPYTPPPPLRHPLPPAEAVEEVLSDLAPNRLCEYLYNLSGGGRHPSSEAPFFTAADGASPLSAPPPPSPPLTQPPHPNHPSPTTPPPRRRVQPVLHRVPGGGLPRGGQPAAAGGGHGGGDAAVLPPPRHQAALPHLNAAVWGGGQISCLPACVLSWPGCPPPPPPPRILSPPRGLEWFADHSQCNAFSAAAVPMPTLGARTEG